MGSAVSTTNVTGIAVSAAGGSCAAAASESGPWSPYARLIAEATFDCVMRVKRSMCVFASSGFPLRWYARARPNSADTRNGSISSAFVNAAIASSYFWLWLAMRPTK